jgi:hypothetical protein
MIPSSENVIKRTIDILHEYYYKMGLRSYRQKDKILVFLDDDNYVEVEPRHVCIPCLHDEVKEKEFREELMRK